MSLDRKLSNTITTQPVQNAINACNSAHTGLRQAIGQLKSGSAFRAKSLTGAFLIMNKQIFQSRLKTLLWTTYRLAQDVGKVRVCVFKKEEKRPATLVTAVAKKIDDFNTYIFEDVKIAIRATGGELIIRYRNC